MKAKLLKVLHFLKLDVLLLRVLKKLSAGLTKKREGIKNLRRFVARRLPATEE